MGHIEQLVLAMLNPVAQIAKDTFGVMNVEEIELESFRPCDIAIEYQHGGPALIHMQYTFRVIPKGGEFNIISLRR